MQYHNDGLEIEGDLNRYFLHSGGGTPDGPYMLQSTSRRHWGDPIKTSLPHNNTNRKKKTKRKQAQASRRNNRGGVIGHGD